MTQIEFAPGVLDDFDRLTENMQVHAVTDIAKRLEEIVRAMAILANNPLIGRPVRGGKRELLIGRDARAYVALCRYVPEVDKAFILAVRSQRESGYKLRRSRF